MSIINIMNRGTRHCLLAGLALTATLGASNAANAAPPFKIEDKEKKAFLQVGALIQPWYQVQTKSAPNAGTENEFFVRRMRLIISGQLNPMVSFFAETDANNFGKEGNYDVNMFVQDAFVEFNLHKMLQIDTGMLLAPFSHQGLQGAGSLLGMDYHAGLMRYPPGSNKVWRDAGIVFRGHLADKLEYRVAVLNGAFGNRKFKPVTPVAGGAPYNEFEDPRNGADAPRITARLAMNILDNEVGPGAAASFYKGIHIQNKDGHIISQKKILTIGGSIDWQRNLNITYNPPAGGTHSIKEHKDYLALNGDIFWDIPVDAQKLMSVNGQVAFYRYDHGDRSLGTNSGYNAMAAMNPTASATFSPASAYTGNGIFAEVGYRYDFIQPIFLLDYYKADSSKTAPDTKNDAGKNLGDLMGVYGGVNWWLDAHSTNIKMQVGSEKVNGQDAKVSGRVQAQLTF